jgi:hypothetical protein
MVPPFVDGIAYFFLAPASPMTAALGVMGIWLIYLIPNPRPLAAARRRKITPAGRPVSTSARQRASVDNKANLSSQPTERSKQ